MLVNGLNSLGKFSFSTTANSLSAVSVLTKDLNSNDTSDDTLIRLNI